jgi:hypothetical protein
MVVALLWFLITPLLILGWWLARRGFRHASIGTLWLYAGLSVFVLGHYFYASPSELSLRINLLIGIEASFAALLLVLAPFAVARRSFAIHCGGRNHSHRWTRRSHS